jgi:hypothetical protein
MIVYLQEYSDMRESDENIKNTLMSSTLVAGNLC